MPRLPPLNALRAFDAAGRRLSFRAAAEDLGVTQAAVAQQVRKLESHLGVVLFDRLPNGLALTHAGRSYHGGIADGFAKLQAATDQLSPKPGKVTISVTPTFASKWLIPNLPDLSAAHPDIDLRILATEAVSSFHSEGIDLAIRQGTPPFGASLEATLLFRQEIIAVAAPSLIRKFSSTSNDNTLSSMPKIHDAHDMWPTFLDELGIRDTSSRNLRLSQTALALDAAVSGQGVALVSRFFAARDLQQGHLVEVTATSLERDQHFYLLTPRKAPKNHAVSKVKSWLKAHADG